MMVKLSSEEYIALTSDEKSVSGGRNKHAQMSPERREPEACGELKQ